VEWQVNGKWFKVFRAAAGDSLTSYHRDVPAKKLKNQPRHLYRTKSIHTCPKKPDISRETLSLNNKIAKH